MLKQNRTVLIVNQHIGFLADRLSEHYTILKAWEPLPDDERRSVTTLVVAGEVSLSTKFIQSFPSVGLIACFTTGYDGIDVAWALANGIKVTRATGVNSEDVADHVLGLLIALQRDILVGDQIVKNGQWSAKTKIITKSLADLSVGIVGMGAIGQAVAKRCQPFGMKVQWWGPRPKQNIPHWRTYSLEKLAQESDVLVIASRADSTNRHLVSGEILDALGPRGILINVARGSLVDEGALIDRLQSGGIAGAALDVFEIEPTAPEKWVDVPNVILTPHTAGATEKVLPKLIEQLDANIQAFYAGRDLVTPIAA